jgi:hypothetical protein
MRYVIHRQLPDIFVRPPAILIGDVGELGLSRANPFSEYQIYGTVAASSSSGHRCCTAEATCTWSVLGGVGERGGEQYDADGSKRW